jgi:membrane AbrB-like protein
MNIATHPTFNALFLCALGGAIAQWLHIPLPWMIGPMLAMAAANMAALPVQPPKGGRETGQLIIGTAIGIFFTPAVMREVANTVGIMLLAGAAAILIGYLTAMAVARLARVDRKTAFFACVPGGAAEMVLLGERYGAAADFVAMSQSLRMMLVVLVVPPLFAWSGVTGSDLYSAAATGFDPAGLAILFAISAAGALAMQTVGAPTPWLLGPLVCSVIVTGSGHAFSSMPFALSALGQALIGCSIGSRFERDFLLKAPRLMAAAVAGFFITLSLSGLMGMSLSAATRVPMPTMILATAPGGIAEMSITAKVLGLGVPLVTAFHVTRLLLLLTMTSPTYRFVMYLRHRTSH